MSETPGRRFYEEQLAYLMANDTDGLIDRHYNDDAVLVSFGAIVKGREALKNHFRGYMKQLGALKLKSTDKFAETDSAIFFEATMQSALGEARVYDACPQKRQDFISFHRPAWEGGMREAPGFLQPS
jgi:hypothetical protein